MQGGGAVVKWKDRFVEREGRIKQLIHGPARRSAKHKINGKDNKAWKEFCYVPRCGGLNQ